MRKSNTAPRPQMWTEDSDGMFSLVFDKKKNRAAGCFLLFFSIFWNAITWTILVMFIKEGDESKWMFLFFVPFVLVGLGTAVGAFFALTGGALTRMRLSPPKVRVSRQPLRLGETFRVEVAQMAKRSVQLTGMSVELSGREWVAYRRGTTTYHDTHDILKEKAELVPAQSISPGRPFGGTCSFTIPAEVMHSFHAPNNRIEWTLKVHSGVAGWLDQKTEFSLQVLPRMVQGS